MIIVFLMVERGQRFRSLNKMNPNACVHTIKANRALLPNEQSKWASWRGFGSETRILLSEFADYSNEFRVIIYGIWPLSSGSFHASYALAQTHLLYTHTHIVHPILYEKFIKSEFISRRVAANQNEHKHTTHKHKIKNKFMLAIYDSRWQLTESKSCCSDGKHGAFVINY